MRAAETKQELVEQLVHVGRTAAQQGYVLASGGNLSARLPGSDTFLVTASGVWFDQLSPSDFVTMDLAGELVGDSPRPSSEWKLHQRTYRERDDINAVVHLHPQYAVLVDALGYPIRLFTLDHAAYVTSIGRTGYYPNGSDELADTAAAEARRHNCVVLAHHGCSALGPDVGMAFRRATNLEEAAAATFRALSLGDTTTQFPAGASAQLHQP